MAKSDDWKAAYSISLQLIEASNNGVLFCIGMLVIRIASCLAMTRSVRGGEAQISTCLCRFAPDCRFASLRAKRGNPVDRTRNPSINKEGRAVRRGLPLNANEAGESPAKGLLLVIVFAFLFFLAALAYEVGASQAGQHEDAFACGREPVLTRVVDARQVDRQLARRRVLSLAVVVVFFHNEHLGHGRCGGHHQCGCYCDYSFLLRLLGLYCYRLFLSRLTCLAVSF